MLQCMSPFLGFVLARGGIASIQFLVLANLFARAHQLL